MDDPISEIEEHSVCPMHIIDLDAVVTTNCVPHPGIEALYEDYGAVGDLLQNLSPDDEFSSVGDFFSDIVMADYDERRLVVQAATPRRRYYNGSGYHASWGWYTMKWFRGTSYEDAMRQAVEWAKGVHAKDKTRDGKL